MNEIQNKKNITTNYKYALTAVIFIFIIGGTVLAYLWNKEKNAIIVPPNTSTPVLSASLSPTSTPTPTITPPQEVWRTFTSSELGFSIKYPQMVYGVNRCMASNPFWVPLKVFEDSKNGVVYITEGYYYEAPYDGKLGKFTGPCEKITYSLESLRQNGIWLGRTIVTGNIKNNDELNKFIKNNYGSDCFVKDKKPWMQKGVEEINIQEKNVGEEDINPNCPLNFSYKILYAPEKNKAVSIKLGQECGFYSNPNSQSYKCYDEEMLNSFKFN